LTYFSILGENVHGNQSLEKPCESVNGQIKI
jgi:hypothetical protein